MTNNIIYKSTIFKDTSDVLALDVTQNNIDKTDFETNFKSLANTLTDFIFGENNVFVQLSFTDFKTKVISWNDVSYSEKNKKYDIFLPINELSFSNGKLSVDATVTVSNIVNDSNIFLNDIFTPYVKNTETTFRTYTVPTGKTFRIVAFQANTNHPLGADISLKINGIAKMKFYLDPSFQNTDIRVYTAPVKIADPGDVVTLTYNVQKASNEINTILIGIES